MTEQEALATQQLTDHEMPPLIYSDEENSCDSVEEYQMSDIVASRLNAYKQCALGSTLWTHLTLAPDGVVCDKATNEENPTTYSFPDPMTGHVTTGNAFDIEVYEGRWNWGVLHCLFEQLFEDGWTCQPHAIEINL